MGDSSSSPGLRLAVLISGGGTTLKNLLDRAGSDELPAGVALVISTNPGAGGLKYAAEAGVPRIVVQRAKFADAQQFSQAIFQPCREADVDLVVMGGFLKYLPIATDFQNRVMNIHPSLIPAFCGKGFYGSRVHQAVLEYGAKVSGCTVHFVDDLYDHGPIILQRTVPVWDDDTVETLQQRVFDEECVAYPEAIRLYAEGQLRVVERRVRRGS